LQRIFLAGVLGSARRASQGVNTSSRDPSKGQSRILSGISLAPQITCYGARRCALSAVERFVVFINRDCQRLNELSEMNHELQRRVRELTAILTVGKA
jgi:hypothetical protein